VFPVACRSPPLFSCRHSAREADPTRPSFIVLQLFLRTMPSFGFVAPNGAKCGPYRSPEIPPSRFYHDQNWPPPLHSSDSSPLFFFFFVRSAPSRPVRLRLRYGIGLPLSISVLSPMPFQCVLCASGAPPFFCYSHFALVQFCRSLACCSS